MKKEIFILLTAFSLDLAHTVLGYFLRLGGRSATILSTLLAFSAGLNEASAASWEIHDPCRDRILCQGQYPTAFPYPSLGQFSIDRLRKNKIPFIGSDMGLASILHTPQGDDSLVVASDTEMYAYGWCYHINGTEPLFMSDQIQIKNDSDVIKWFFAYSTYKNGEWKTMCAPAYTRPLKAYCH